jgi:hypothetical protein
MPLFVEAAAVAEPATAAAADNTKYKPSMYSIQHCLPYQLLADGPSVRDLTLNGRHSTQQAALLLQPLQVLAAAAAAGNGCSVSVRARPSSKRVHSPNRHTRLV